MSDSTPPSDSARVNRRVPSAIAIARSAAVRPAAPPGRAGTRPSRRSPGSGPRDVRAAAQPGHDRDGVRAVPLHPQVERPQAAQDEEAVERSGHRAHRVLEEPQALGDGRVRGDRHAEDRVGVTGEVLRRRVEDDVGAVLERPLERRRGERVVDHDQRPPATLARRAARRVAATASMSTTLSSGFDGVSNQTSRVRSVSASQSTSGPAARST